MAPGFDGLEIVGSTAFFLEDGGGAHGPDEGFVRAVVVVVIVVDCVFEFGDAFEDASSDALARDLGEEALDKVEPRRAGRREMAMEAQMLDEPRLSRPTFCGSHGCRAQDARRDASARNATVDPLQETHELLGAMPWLAVADHQTALHIERCEQRRRAVPFVVVRHRGGAALLQGQPRLRAIKGLYLALFIDAQDQSSSGGLT